MYGPSDHCYVGTLALPKCVRSWQVLLDSANPDNDYETQKRTSVNKLDVPTIAFILLELGENGTIAFRVF